MLKFRECGVAVSAPGLPALKRLIEVKLFTATLKRCFPLLKQRAPTKNPSKLWRRRVDFHLQSGRGVGMLFRLFRQPSFDGIHPYVFSVLCILIGVSNPVLVVTLLPYFAVEVLLFRCAVGESSLDELHGFLKRYRRSRCKD
jgi:hypothetical protein